MKLKGKAHFIKIDWSKIKKVKDRLFQKKKLTQTGKKLHQQLKTLTKMIAKKDKAENKESLWMLMPSIQTALSQTES